MTQNQTIATALLSLGTFFVGVVPTLYLTNFWGAIACAILGVVIYGVREVLP